MINELVENISSIGRLLEIDPVLICIIIEDEFFSDDEESNEGLREVLNAVYIELAKIENQ